VSAPQPEKALRRQERLPALALAPSERFSELLAQLQEASPGELLELPVWLQARQVRPERLASQQRVPPLEPAAVLLPGRLASSAPLSRRLPSLPSRLLQPLRLALRLLQLPEYFSGLSPQHRRESSSSASFFP